MVTRIFGSLFFLALAAACGAQSPLPADEGAPVIPHDRAGEHIDQMCYVYGHVVLTKNIGTMCFLNFHADFKEHFTVVIKQNDYGKFPEPPEVMYKGKDIKVFGRVIEYQGKPEIIVTSPDQITILTEGLPAPTTRPASTQPVRRPAPGVARIATFNVLNLFDDVDDPYHDDEGTRCKPREELERLAQTIRSVDADVLALEEVENRFYLERFVRTLLPDMGYDEIALIEGNDDRGIDVAVLSRYPIGPVTSYRHLTFSDANGNRMSFERDLLRVRIEPSGPGERAFDVFVVHLKSKSEGEEATLPIRMGEAVQVRKVLDAVLTNDPEARFVLCGDFNDTIGSKPLTTIVGEGAQALVRLIDDVPEADRISYNKAPHRSMIDFILCSPAMGRCYQKGSCRIVQGTVEGSGSDHNPVIATFDLR